MLRMSYAIHDEVVDGDVVVDVDVVDRVNVLCSNNEINFIQTKVS